MPKNTPIKHVTVYSKPGCGGCIYSVRALEGMGFEPKIIDISKDPSAYELVLAMGYQQVPVVVTDDDHWSGARPDKIEMLESRSPNALADSAVAVAG